MRGRHCGRLHFVFRALAVFLPQEQVPVCSSIPRCAAAAPGSVCWGRGGPSPGAPMAGLASVISSVCEGSLRVAVSGGVCGLPECSVICVVLAVCPGSASGTACCMCEWDGSDAVWVVRVVQSFVLLGLCALPAVVVR